MFEAYTHALDLSHKGSLKKNALMVHKMKYTKCMEWLFYNADITRINLIATNHQLEAHNYMQGIFSRAPDNKHVCIKVDVMLQIHIIFKV